ncbi:hypothetical protein MHU86_9584 (mitochondrion) [Fragilaria crotonensis]|nr:hypothetical protein MHU86_9584 [Fragilaria crotonensis]
MGVPIEKKRRNNVSGSWKKTKLEKNWYRGRGGFSRGREATEQDFSDSNREGVLGEGKLSTKNGVLSAKLDENRIVFTKIDKI